MLARNRKKHRIIWITARTVRVSFSSENLGDKFSGRLGGIQQLNMFVFILVGIKRFCLKSLKKMGG